MLSLQFSGGDRRVNKSLNPGWYPGLCPFRLDWPSGRDETLLRLGIEIPSELAELLMPTQRRFGSLLFLMWGFLFATACRTPEGAVSYPQLQRQAWSNPDWHLDADLQDNGGPAVTSPSYDTLTALLPPMCPVPFWPPPEASLGDGFSILYSWYQK